MRVKIQILFNQTRDHKQTWRKVPASLLMDQEEETLEFNFALLRVLRLYDEGATNFRRLLVGNQSARACHERIKGDRGDQHKRARAYKGYSMGR